MKKILLFICLNIYFINYCAEDDVYLCDEEVFINGVIYLRPDPANDQEAEKSIMESLRICSATMDSLHATEEEKVKLVALQNFLVYFIKQDPDTKELYDFLYKYFDDIKLLKFLSPLQRQSETVAKALRFKKADGVYRKISQTLFFFITIVYEKYQKKLECEQFFKKKFGCCYKVSAFFNAVKTKAKSFF